MKSAGAWLKAGWLILIFLLLAVWPVGAQVPVDSPVTGQIQPEEAYLKPGQGQTLTMARATWDTGWFQAEIFKQLLQTLGYRVSGPRTMDNPDFYAAAADGSVDFWVNGWFPLHDTFMQAEGVAQNVRPVGFEVKAGALQGYMVDKETAEALNITSLADLQQPEVAAVFDANRNGRADLIGCNVGWGCEQLVEHHLDAYGLRDTVEHVQGDYGPLMRETLARYRRGEPVLFYTWTPNWTIGKLAPGVDAVWIEVPFPSLPAGQESLETQTLVSGLSGCVADPCQLGFPPNDIRAVANVEFLARQPAVRSLLEEVVIPLDDISDQNARLVDGEGEAADIRRHAQDWIERNQAQVDRWLAAARAAHAASGLALPAEGALPADASPPAVDNELSIPKIDKTLRVATKAFAPFVIYENRQYTGFSIDLWDEIARVLEADYELYGVNSTAKLLDEAERGAADVAMAGIGITSNREQNLDFSHSFFETGLQVMVPSRSNRLFGGFLGVVLQTLLAPEFLYIIGFLLLMLLVSAHVIWLLERDRNPEFPQEYLPGIWESFWWSAVTATTVGYGDKTPRGVWGRLFGLFWMFAGLFVLAYFTAGVTSTATLQELQGTINGPEDLAGHQVATVQRSAAAEYLERQGIDPFEFENEQEAFQALENEQVEAIVYDAPVLQHYASHDGKGRVRVVGLVFEELSYGIAFQHDSPYRERVNLALLQLIEDGTYEELHDKWFGPESEP